MRGRRSSQATHDRARSMAPQLGPRRRRRWLIAAGIRAGIAAAREDMRVVLLEPTRHIGGMTASGLGASDVGIKDSIGGLALEFFHRLGVTYGLARYGAQTSL